jgi:hypothetical protein
MYTPQPTDRITVTDLRPELPEPTKWLMMIRHFLATPGLPIGQEILKDMYKQYQAAKKRDTALSMADIHAELTTLSQPTADPLAADLAKIRANLSAVTMSNGKINRSAVGRLLNITPGGASWPRLQQLCTIIEAENEN